MAVVIGTNAGFVTVAPSGDPSGTQMSIGNTMEALKDTSPADAAVVTEIGWWCNFATAEANYEVAIYDHDSGDDDPLNIVGVKDDTNAKGTDVGWKRVTGLNIEISPSTIYWIAVQCDVAASVTAYTAGGRMAYKTSVFTLPDPWDGTSELSRIAAFYAVYTTAGTNMQVNIGDTWKDVAAMQVNIGDTWKDVAGAQINIGDTWKTIF